MGPAEIRGQPGVDFHIRDKYQVSCKEAEALALIEVGRGDSAFTRDCYGRAVGVMYSFSYDP